jgi:hypothetical protein
VRGEIDAVDRGALTAPVAAREPAGAAPGRSSEDRRRRSAVMCDDAGARGAPGRGVTRIVIAMSHSDSVLPNHSLFGNNSSK